MRKALRMIHANANLSDDELRSLMWEVVDQAHQYELTRPHIEEGTYHLDIEVDVFEESEKDPKPIVTNVSLYIEHRGNKQTDALRKFRGRNTRRRKL